MKYLNKLLLSACLLFNFSLKSICQKPLTIPYKIDFYTGYVANLWIMKSGCYPLLLSVMVDNIDFIKTCKNLSINEVVNWFINNSYLIPLQIFSDRMMFEELCGGLNIELMNNILKYQENYTKQSYYYIKHGNVKLKANYKLYYEYSKYSGIIFIPLKGNELYNFDCSESINFEEYPNIKIVMPIYSGYSR